MTVARPKKNLPKEKRYNSCTFNFLFIKQKNILLLTVDDVQRDVCGAHLRGPALVGARVRLPRPPDGQGAHGGALGEVLGRAHLRSTGVSQN